jgi:predicted deacylase
MGVMLLAAASAAACVLPIGRSVEQRDVILLEFGSGPKSVLLVGGLHTGTEDNSRVIVTQLAEYIAVHPEVVPPSVTLYVVPSANPDGTANGTHANARGVDLNRNWPADNWTPDACHPASGCLAGLGGPAPLSEPETAALYDFVRTMRPELTLVWHSEAALVEANEVPGSEHYGRTFAAAAGYEYIEEWPWYVITGQLIDALEQRLGLRAIDVELADCCAVTQDDFDRNLAGLQATLAEVARSAEPRRGRTPSASPEPRATPTPDFSRLRLPD